MSLWTEITNTALIGCERKPLSLNRATDTLAGLLAQFDQNDREGALLGAAALVSLYERAGTLPVRDTQPLPEACEPDDAPPCGDKAAIHLAMMLRGQYGELLPEWLTRASAMGKRAPEELLPQLLELARGAAHVRELALPVLGRRGRWLAAQNPRWSCAEPVYDEQSWHLGSHEARLSFLRKLRVTDTARSRELLASTWNDEKPDHRAEFLSVFEIGLSLEDEPALEAALDDRSKNVVQSAAKLLVQIPQSRLRQRMIDRARPLIGLKKKSRGKTALEVIPPETCDAAMARDGVSSKPPSHESIGPKAWLLKQIVSLTPPSTWSQSLGLTADELARAALADKDWGEILPQSLASAAAHHRDYEWAEAIFNLQGRKGLKLDWRTFFESLPDELKEKYLLAELRSGTSLEEVTEELYWCGHQWSRILSQVVLSALCQNLKDGNVLDRWNWTNMLTSVALRLDPTQISEALSKISTSVQKDSKPLYGLDNCLNTLQFRHEMLKEINQ